MQLKSAPTCREVRHNNSVISVTLSQLHCITLWNCRSSSQWSTLWRSHFIVLFLNANLSGWSKIPWYCLKLVGFKPLTDNKLERPGFKVQQFLISLWSSERTAKSFFIFATEIHDFRSSQSAKKHEWFNSAFSFFFLPKRIPHPWKKLFLTVSNQVLKKY